MSIKPQWWSIGGSKIPMTALIEKPMIETLQRKEALTKDYI